MKTKVVLFVLLVICSVVFSFSGGDGSESSPYLISNKWELNDVNYDLDAHYALANDIDDAGGSGAVIAPDNYASGISFYGIPFSGTFDGRGYKLTSLSVVNYSDNMFYTGLFGQIAPTGVVKNLIIENCTINSVTQFTGGICAYNDGGTITNCRVSGTISGTYAVGGITGHNELGLIDECISECTLNADGYCGGLTGEDIEGVYNNCGTDCQINVSSERAGGLIGSAGDNIWGGDGCTVYQCTASGEINNQGNYSGGLGGKMYKSSFEQCYSVASVRGTGSDSDYIGGLCGFGYYATITDCYNLGSVSGEGATSDFVGGLAGYCYSGSAVNNCYTVASVSCSNPSPSHLAPAIGYRYGSQITNCFWDSDVCLLASDNYATALNTAGMQTLSSFTGAGWDFVGETTNGTDDTWWMSAYGGYPKLDWQLKPMGMDKYNLMAMYWGQTGCTPGTDCYDADWYRDGTIDENDLVRLSMSWLDKEILIYEP
ncbi:MAG: GLUG motif-containing protein [Sedimentisphaeraceae bacterium JB056]